MNDSKRGNDWGKALGALRRAGYAAWHRPPRGVVKDDAGRYQAVAATAKCPTCGWTMRPVGTSEAVCDICGASA